MTTRPLRSTQWFGPHDNDGFIHRSWMKNHGIPQDLLDGRPIVGICNTWSELTPCNAQFWAMAERVKRGVYEAGGYSVEFPVISPGESIGDPLPLVRNGDFDLDVGARRLHIDVSDDDLASRRTAWQAPVPPVSSSDQRLYIDNVLEAETGADLAFLVGCRGAAAPKESN